MNQIEQGKHILKMIEGLARYTEEEILRDHVDTLDEIDARFFYWHNSIAFDWGNKVTFERFMKLNYDPRPQVTRCRTTLKSARPDGWRITIMCQHTYDAFSCELFSIKHTTKFWLAPTEEISELHAITQARIWELENEG